MAQLPRKPRAGTRWEDQRASEWATLIDEVKRLRDEVNAFKKGEVTVTPALRQTVLIVREPHADDKVLKVKRVVYKDYPPRDCNPSCHYAFEGPEFEAFPDIGVENIEDYSDVWDATKPLDAEQPYAKAYWERGRWFVEKPTAASVEIDDCVILATHHTPGSTVVDGVTVQHSTLSSALLIVQRIHFDDTLATPNYVAKGNPMIVGTRANCPGELYDDYADTRPNPTGGFSVSDAGKNNIGDARAVYCEIKKKDGIWRVSQEPPFAIRTVPSGTAAACSTV